MRLTFSILLFAFMNAPFVGISQESSLSSVDFKRVKLHEDIDRLQLRLLSPVDSTQNQTHLELADVNPWYTMRLDSMQYFFESDTALPHRLKVKYLTGLILLLQESIERKRQDLVDEKYGTDLLSAYARVVKTDKLGNSLMGLAKENPYSINAAIFGSNTVFFDHPEIMDLKIEVYKQFADLFPEKVLSTLEPYLNLRLADTLIIRSAKQFPSQFYDYASASKSELGKKIKTVQDSTVQMLYKIAQDKSGRLLFPFLPLLLEHTLTYEKLKANSAREVAYFSMLVQARIELGKKEDADKISFFKEEMDRMIIRKSEEIFINQINTRHELGDSARFSIIRSFKPLEIYYLIVSGENTLYTSSYLGLYKRMMERCSGMRADSILLSVGHDRFRKFLKMAAAYNKLGDFLNNMPDSTAFSLIKKFVIGLDQGADIADAVDVADAFASVEGTKLKVQIIDEVISNLVQAEAAGNMKGIRIYGLLNTLFDSSKNINLVLDTVYQIPDVFNVNYNDVADIAGKVVEQVFFYGDQDSKVSYDNFMTGFRDKAEWKIIEKENWVEIRSLIGKSIWIFANLPFANPAESEKYIKAQHLLKDYLDSMKIFPTVVVHRGHSYYLKQTINQFPPNAKIILVGSCGGYQLLNAMLEKCMNAHIISTKEVGTKTVNDPILKSINEALRNGANINWINFWTNLGNQFSSGLDKLRFENYIPPHKNLGAIFIKAYSSILERGAN